MTVAEETPLQDEFIDPSMQSAFRSSPGQCNRCATTLMPIAKFCHVCGTPCGASAGTMYSSKSPAASSHRWWPVRAILGLIFRLSMVGVWCFGALWVDRLMFRGQYVNYAIGASVLFAIIALLSFGYRRSDYVELAGAVDSNDNIRCVYCGSADVIISKSKGKCSGCGKGLWNK